MIGDKNKQPVGRYGILLPAAMLLAMFSLVAATLIIKLSNQSLALTKFSEKAQQQRLQARAEVNRLLAQLSQGDSPEEFLKQKRSPQHDSGISWTSWLERDPENEEFLHLHAEVWDTSKGPPGERFSRVIQIRPARQQMQFAQVADFTDFNLFFRDVGQAGWNKVPSPFTNEPGHIRNFSSFEADELGGVFVAESDEKVTPPAEITFRFRRFDTISGTWSTLAAPPGGGLHSLSYHDGRVVALTNQAPGPEIKYTRVSVYDVDTDSWTTLPPPPNRVYDQSGSFRALPGGLSSTDIDVGPEGNIYLRPTVSPDSAHLDNNTTVHRWDGREWSTLPPVPTSLIPAVPPGVASAQVAPRSFNYNYRQMTTIGEDSIVMARTDLGLTHHSTSLLEFDGADWKERPMPTVGELTGEPTPFLHIDGTFELLGLSDPIPYLTNLSSNSDGDLFVGTQQVLTTFDEGNYRKLNLPPVDPAFTFGLSNGSRPTEGDSTIETLVSF